MPSGDTLGFMKITMWALSESDFVERVRAYLEKYGGQPLALENIERVKPPRDYGDEVNGMIEETLEDCQAVRLGTFFSYRAN